PEQWIPLDAPEASRELMRSRTPPSTFQHGIRRGLAEALWSGVSAIRHRAPFCVLAERVGTAVGGVGGAGGEDVSRGRGGKDLAGARGEENIEARTDPPPLAPGVRTGEGGVDEGGDGGE